MSFPINTFIRRTTIYLLVLFGLLFFLRSTQLGATFNHWMNETVASSCAKELRLLGVDAGSDHTMIYTLFYDVRIIDVCNGLLAMSLLIAACLTIPISWKQKIAGVFLSITVVFVLNQLRLMSVMIVGSRWPLWVDFYEEVLIRAAHWVVTITLFCVWARAVIQKEKNYEG